MRTLTDKDVVVITGNNGLLGEAVVTTLGRRGDQNADGHFELRGRVPQLVGLDRDGQPQPPQYCECILFDLTDEKSIALGLRRLAWQYGKRIAGFVHLAAYYDFSGKDHPLYEAVTIEGTRRLLQALRAHEFEVERFIFSSTMLIHAPCEIGKPIDEKSPIEPAWAYPKSKTKTEQVIREERGDYPATNLRIAGVYSDACDSIPISHQIQRIHEKRVKSHFYSADPNVGQSFVHLQDTADAIIAAIERREEQPEEANYLIGEPETYSYARLQDRLGELLHGREDWTTLQVPEAIARAGAAVQDAASALPGVPEPFIKPWMIGQAGDHYELDISAARRDLDWEPKHRLIDTLPAMVESLKRDPAAFYKRHDLGDPPA